MTYRSLLVLLGNDNGQAARRSAAIDLAARLQAHLVGLAPTGLVDLPVVIDPSGSMGNLTQLAWTQLRSSAAGTASDFSAACERAGLPSFETVVDEADRVASLVHHAHCSDLCIVSQPDPDEEAHGSLQRAVEQTVLNCARPTLVLPHAGRFERIGSRALVAWDDSREAARAVSDALPLLRTASHVQVIHWLESTSDDAALPGERLEALRRWLMWQGVSADVRTDSLSSAITAAMLARAAELGSDLLVMGAYGHPRWAERILGGATRGILASMTLPVLMSH